MAEEVHQFSCTIPAGTAKSSPHRVPMTMPHYEVVSIDLEVPPGPSGLMGFYLELGSNQWIPWEMGEWIVWNDRTESWDIDNSPNSETWALVGYNTGAYDHTVQVRFHLNSAVQAGTTAKATEEFTVGGVTYTGVLV